MGIIVDVYGREVLDSRGNPTVEVEVTLDDGSMVALRFPQALPRAHSKRSSCAMAILNATSAKARSRRFLM